MRLLPGPEEDVHPGLETLEDHQLPTFPRCSQADTQLLPHNIIVTKGLDEGHKADFTISFEIEGEKVVHKETAICLGITE